jgi:fatty-acyl-CoA synthase
VILHEGASLTTAELRNFCRDKIAHQKIPCYVKFIDSFPLTVTVTGKVQKYLMREAMIEELGESVRA